MEPLEGFAHVAAAPQTLAGTLDLHLPVITLPSNQSWGLLLNLMFLSSGLD